MALNLYSVEGGKLVRRPWAAGEAIPTDTRWLDLFCPTAEEEGAVESYLSMEVPTREEMREIEVSNRLYQESGYLFMTATMLAKFDIDAPESHAVTFIVNHARLITVRYTDPMPFRTFPTQLERMGGEACGGYNVFMGLLEAIVNRAADILENIGQEVDRITKEVFRQQEQQADYKAALRRIGHCGDSASKLRESLITLWRIDTYATQNLKDLTPEQAAYLAAISKDISALSDHASFVSGNVGFVLQATLGLINIDQNNIIKIFSIAAVVFLPPTLVASIYGMNFRHMPELDWLLGYPMALALMAVAAVLPILYFKRRKWL